MTQRVRGGLRPEARGDLVAVLGGHLALGLLGAVLWWLLVEPARFTVSPEGAVGMGELELGRRFAVDGWFTVVALVLGLLGGGGFMWWRSRDPLLTAGLLVAGSVLATAVMAGLGGLLGPPDPGPAAAQARPGATVPAALQVQAEVCYLVWPIATLAGALMVLWSPGGETEI